MMILNCKHNSSSLFSHHRDNEGTQNYFTAYLSVLFLLSVSTKGSSLMCRLITLTTDRYDKNELIYQCMSLHTLEKQDRGKMKSPVPYFILGMFFLLTRDSKKSIISLSSFVNAFRNNSLDASRREDIMSCKPQEESSQQNHSQNHEGKK